MTRGEEQTTLEEREGTDDKTVSAAKGPAESADNLAQGDRSEVLDSDASVHRAAVHGIQGPVSPLPHLQTIQASFGRHDVSQISAHMGARATEAAAAMGAQAYATGNHVAFKPDLAQRYEAAHVVQQRAGVALKGGVG